ncbi:Hypothetical predicted protein [Mytilus galloprovincialis]|uniref:Fork-head domain-containing protein n=1 Tax=Mytilus galloprovincialis TaxID=29158 RepID=A0A8B6D9B5_MYTGA|nr:Hypothetical predicted protein [Mytilus galloprovincialis]
MINSQFSIDYLTRVDSETVQRDSLSSEGDRVETPSPCTSESESSCSDSAESIAQVLLSLDRSIKNGLCSSDPNEKPPHSYIAMISMAILSKLDKKILLNDIYQYIMENFPFYNNKEKAWRNSIRHNLSLNECFIKNGRSDNGKGNYWSIHPACIDDFSKGDFRRRQARRRARKSTVKSVNGSPNENDIRYNLGYVPMTSSQIGFQPYSMKGSPMHSNPHNPYQIFPHAVVSRTQHFILRVRYRKGFLNGRKNFFERRTSSCAMKPIFITRDIVCYKFMNRDINEMVVVPNSTKKYGHLVFSRPAVKRLLKMGTLNPMSRGSWQSKFPRPSSQMASIVTRPTYLIDQRHTSYYEPIALSKATSKGGCSEGYIHEDFLKGLSSLLMKLLWVQLSLDRSIKNILSITNDKPSHSYIAMISMAILSKPNKKMLLNDIYQYIMDGFPFYNNKEKAWRNSIRHNLSLNECFVKNGRSDNGKGNYWSIHLACIEDFAKGDFRRRNARQRARKSSIKTVDGSSNQFYTRNNNGYSPVSPFGRYRKSFLLADIRTNTLLQCHRHIHAMECSYQQIKEVVEGVKGSSEDFAQFLLYLFCTNKIVQCNQNEDVNLMYKIEKGNARIPHPQCRKGLYLNESNHSDSDESIAQVQLCLDRSNKNILPSSITNKKPSHSYIAMISMAILSKPNKKLVLNDIYQYIIDNFPFYNNKEKAWRNSIRHNLSLNECFVKNGRSDNGKGNYWSIHKACIEDFAKGDFRR